MKSAVLAVAALALLAAASMAAATAPTMRGALSQSGLTYVQGVIVPLILAKFGTFSLPDMSFSKDSIDATVSGLTCSSLAIPTHSLTLGTSSLSLSMGGISASCHASWSYKESHWPHIPHGSGTVDAGVSQSTITVSVTPTEANGKPQVAPAGCSANVKVSSLEFHGGLSGDILNLFKGYIEKEISSSLNSQLCSKCVGCRIRLASRAHFIVSLFCYAQGQRFHQDRSQRDARDVPDSAPTAAAGAVQLLRVELRPQRQPKLRSGLPRL